MRKLLLLVFMAFAAVVNVQAETTFRVDSVYLYNSSKSGDYYTYGPKGRIYYTYDEQGRVAQILTIYFNESGVMSPYKKETYAYDEMGLQTEYLYWYYYENSGWQIGSINKKEDHNYVDGLLDNVVIYKLDYSTHTAVASTLTTNTYDENGVLIEDLVQDYNTKDILYKNVYAYHENGVLASKTGYQLIAGEWTQYSLYTYNEQGSQTYYEYLYYSNGVVTFGSKAEYEFDENGWMVTSTTSTIVAGEWVNQEYVEYTHNDMGKITCTMIYSWKDGAWATSAKHESTYDEHGNRLTFLSCKWNGTEWENDMSDEYTYDEHNNMTFHKEISYYGDTEYVDYEKYSYYYDLYGNMTMSFYYKGDDPDNMVYYQERDYFYTEVEVSGIEDINENKALTAPRKRLENGRVVIVRPDGAKFSLNGQRME